MNVSKKVVNAKKKQAGYVMTSELILLATLVVGGLTVGLTTMRDAVNAELEDVSEAIGSLDQSYAFDGMINGEGSAEISGSGYIDAVDTNAGDGVAFQFVASDFAETAAAINATPSTAASSPLTTNGSLD